jgi:hypothetical protein
VGFSRTLNEGDLHENITIYRQSDYGELEMATHHHFLQVLRLRKTLVWGLFQVAHNKTAIATYYVAICRYTFIQKVDL